MEDNPPQQLLRIPDESKMWNFKYYKIMDKNRLFEITEKIIK